MKAETITVHSTANLRSTAKNERDWLVNLENQNTASWHICIDDQGAIEAIPLNEVAWHAGDGQGPGNMTSIAVEICESGDRERTIDNAIALIAQMLIERDWGVERVRKHQDWSGKYCPRILIESWDDFIEKLEEELECLSAIDEEVSTWARDAFKWAVMNGISDGSRPKDSVTREEVWTMLHNFSQMDL